MHADRALPLLFPGAARPRFLPSVALSTGALLHLGMVRLQGGKTALLWDPSQHLPLCVSTWAPSAPQSPLPAWLLVGAQQMSVNEPLNE